MNDQSFQKYDVVVWGATGFTGTLVAEYLLQAYGIDQGLRWAIAGRNREKLEAVRRSLGASASSLDLLEADARDQRSLDVLVRQAKVICSTVGPYARYGGPLAAACVRAGTDYCDLAGEPLWIQRMIDEHHDAAQASGARLVCSCGFDSIPSDCGVAFLVEHVRRTTGQSCSRIALRVEHSNGTMSGGTVAAILDTVRTIRTDSVGAAVLADPYSLNPVGERSGPDGPDLRGAAFDDKLGVWVFPFLMEGINTRVVRRTNALLGYPYGKKFRYSEAVIAGEGLQGRLKAVSTSLILAGFMRGLTYAPGLVRPLLPRPGQGPSKSQQERGSFSMLLVGEREDGGLAKLRVTGNRDPGYGCTSRMLGESAVCLAKDVARDLPGGVLTPATAMQKELVPRLIKRAAMDFEVLPG